MLTHATRTEAGGVIFSRLESRGGWRVAVFYGCEDIKPTAGTLQAAFLMSEGPGVARNIHPCNGLLGMGEYARTR